MENENPPGGTQYNLVWIDCEMTGLDPESNKIIEIAVVLTDDHLVEIKYGPTLQIRVDDEDLINMEEWSAKTHAESGLIDLIKSQGVPINKAEEIIHDFLEKNLSKDQKQRLIEGKPPYELCGNSVWHDLFFMRKETPKVLQLIKPVPILDVSSIALNESMMDPDYKRFDKKKTHRALDDIKESIAELRYLRSLHWE
jgi:oligoribonuclease